MYSLQSFGAMIADRIRTDAYYAALRQAVRPGSVVLDIGTGTGIFALLARRLGARKVYAVEPSDAIQVAREIAGANDCDDHIEFIQKLSTEIELPERPDVIVSDIRGVLPLFDHHLPSIIDARERLLAPGGILIPQSDSLWAAVVEAPELYKRFAEPWEGKPYDIEMMPARPISTNSWGSGRVKPDQLLAEPKCWATLDYRSVDQPDVRGEVTWTLARAGTAHGLSVWFDATLTDGVAYSSSPLCGAGPESIYGTAFFPLSAPVCLAAGDVVAVVLNANLVGGDYVWCWNTQVKEKDEAVIARFHQSTFFGTPLSSGRLRKRAASHVPRLNEDGQVDQYILGLMDGRTSLSDVARCLGDRFPHRFPTVQKALSYVGDLSLRYS
jgi:type I protein arginine methyltransferase